MAAIELQTGWCKLRSPLRRVRAARSITGLRDLDSVAVSALASGLCAFSTAQ